jgi:orotidine 5'-phosphate decarboxylase subfamily 2
VIFERLKQKILESNNALIVGIDPHLQTRKDTTWVSSDRDYLWEFSTRTIAASKGVAGIKIQSAFFEALNQCALLPDIVKFAHSQNLMVILDAKRADIGSTMYAYGYAAFETIKADFLTVNPFMGTEILTQLSQWTTPKNKGLFVLLQTSNILDERLQDAAYILETFKNETSIGFVVGLNRVDSLSGNIFDELIDKYCLLLPGLGAQSAQSKHLARFLNSDALKQKSTGACGIFPVSRALYPSSWSSWDDFEFHVSNEIEIWKKVLRLQHTL